MITLAILSLVVSTVTLVLNGILLRIAVRRAMEADRFAAKLAATGRASARTQQQRAHHADPRAN